MISTGDDMQVKAVAKLLGVRVSTAKEQEAYVRGRGWRSEPAWRVANGKRVSTRGEDWFCPNDTLDYSLDDAILTQLTRDAVAFLEARGWEVTGGGSRDAGWTLVHEVSKRLDGGVVRSTLVGALRRECADGVRVALH